MSQRHRKTFIGAIKRALARANVRSGASILVALSGGPDSVALLHAMAQLREDSGYRLSAAHLNHNLRGPESDRDEAFCRRLCDQLGVQIIVGRASALDPAMPNLEEAARGARHEFLNRVADEVGAEHIATGHHADDQAETVMMRLLRGAGVAGLSAMAPSGPGRIVRPMLSLGRDDILKYLDSIGAAFVTDSSNLSTAMLRNRIRRDLLPEIERDYAPGVSRRLAALAQEARIIDSYLSRVAAQELTAIAIPGGGVSVARFAKLDPALRIPVLRLYLASELGDLRRVNRKHLEAVERLCLAGPVNGVLSLPGGWRAVREYDRMQIQKARQRTRAEFSVPLAFDGITQVPEAGFTFAAEVVPAGEMEMPDDHWSAIFDLGAAAPAGLIARSFRPGDTIRPLGLAGTRKVKDVFIDRKVPRGERAVFPVIAMGREILWLPGLARGCGALVGSATEAAVFISARRTGR